MEQKEIIVKVYNDRILLNPQLSIPINQTNIPIEHLRFNSQKEIFWKVEMLAYFSVDKCLKVRVKEYSSIDTKKFEFQNPKKEIKQILFEKFDWIKISPLLIFFQKIKLQEIITNIDANPVSNESNGQLKYRDIDYPKSSKKIKEEPTPSIANIKEEFSIYFADSRFRLGYVTFKKHIKRLDAEFDFKITNEHILAEFDNIRYWFAKKLQKKKFKVTATIFIEDNKVTETKAFSKDIDQITPELIDSVKYQRTLALTKEPKLSSPDKSLFTSEDVFTQIDSNDVEGNVFNQTEEDILNFLLENGNVRNRKQLAYLAGKKQSENHKLRYTLNPNFGFLFFVEGAENNHFIWELLNSHATYIWSIDKSDKAIELQFKRIESIVNTVRTQGREGYKRAYRNNKQDNDLVFRVINHKGIDSDFVDDFIKWKAKLNEQLL